MGRTLNKRGFGIMEVLVAMVVLGFLLTALIHLQNSNRNSLLRIRSRDGANMVAQSVIDSLSGVGAAMLPGDTTLNLSKERTWEGRPGLLSATGHKSTVRYDVVVGISNDSLYRSTEKSSYDSYTHIYAKRLNVKVSWAFKSSTQTIEVSGVVR